MHSLQTELIHSLDWHSPLVHLEKPQPMHRSISCSTESLSQNRVRTVQETKWDAEREKACINTYAHASASQICLQNLCEQQQNSPMADPTFGSKSGSQNGAQAKT